MSGTLSCFKIVVCGDQGTDHRLPPRPPARGAFLAALEPAFLDSAAFSAALAALDFFMRSFTSLHWEDREVWSKPGFACRLLHPGQASELPFD